MDDTKKLLARKYAQAFINVFYLDISLKQVTILKTLITYLTKFNESRLFLELSLIPESIKRQALAEVFRSFELPIIFEKIVDVLLARKVLFLLPNVLYYIHQYYYEEAGITAFHITSSHELTVASCEDLKHFLEKKIGKRVIYTYAIDSSLIAGVRLQSNNFLWEYSIKKQIENMRRLLVR